MAVAVALLIGPFRRRLRNLDKAEGERQASLVEAIHGMRTIRARAMEGLRSRAWDDTSARVVAMRYEVDRPGLGRGTAGALRAEHRGPGTA